MIPDAKIDEIIEYAAAGDPLKDVCDVDAVVVELAHEVRQLRRKLRWIAAAAKWDEKGENWQ